MCVQMNKKNGFVMRFSSATPDFVVCSRHFQLTWLFHNYSSLQHFKQIILQYVCYIFVYIVYLIT